MSRADFADARAKLARARVHIADVNTAITGYLATNFYQFTVQTNKDGTFELIFQSLHQPDQALNATIGDAISNLRSTLDYTVNAALFPITGKRDAGGYPFADDAKGVGGQAKVVLAPLGQAVIDHVVDQMQGYQGGAGHTLWALNKLRNIDKHRLLVATAQNVGVRLSFIETVNQNSFNGVGIVFPAGQQRSIFKAPIGGVNIQFTQEPQPLFEVLLREPPYFEGEVRAFLEEAAKQIETLLNFLDI